MFTNDQQKIQPLLNLFDSIQEILQNTNEIDLPKIVVIGDQSSGKSSVLESIAQINLPRGENTVTRSPISIQMRNNIDTYAEVNYQFDDELLRSQGKSIENSKIVRTFSSFDDIDQELRKATQDILKIEQKEVTQTQINLKLQSPQMPNLTLIDLPGLTYKNAQFSEAVKQMYRKYIQNPSTIILVVMPADQDFTNTEANIIAAEKDELKIRTLGIVTKIDRHMSHFGKKLEKNDLNYKLGIFLVRNRTQDELEQKITYEEVRKREQLILQEDELQSFPSSHKGTTALINLLIKLQNNQVMQEKHRVRDDIVQKISDIKKELSTFPEPCVEVKQKHNIFVSMLHKFQQDLDKVYNGNYGAIFKKNSEHLRARIDEMFERHSQVCYSLQQNYLSTDYRKELQSTIGERKGVQLYNFLSFQCFVELFAEQIFLLEQPSEKLLREIFSYLQSLYTQIIGKHFSKFHQLEEMIVRELTLFLLKLEDQIKLELKLQFKKESVIIFTKNPLYLDVLDKMKDYLTDENEAQKKPNNNKEKKDFLQIYDLKVQKNDCCKELFESDVETSSFDFQTTEMQLSLFSYSNTLFKRLMDYIYSDILYQISLLSNNLYDLYNFFLQQSFIKSFYEKFSPIAGTFAHESKLWISNAPNIESKRMQLEKSLKILLAALGKFEDFERI